MARVFITGSADGLGRAAAQTLLNDGHEVVVHARNRDRLTAVRELLDRARQPSSGTWPTPSSRATSLAK
jgi:NAD(P)-dependent dehydrogenase (short-subunit alcohol dehydrogenase family)